MRLVVQRLASVPLGLLDQPRELWRLGGFRDFGGFGGVPSRSLLVLLFLFGVLHQHQGRAMGVNAGTHLVRAWRTAHATSQRT